MVPNKRSPLTQRLPGSSSPRSPAMARSASVPFSPRTRSLLIPAQFDTANEEALSPYAQRLLEEERRRSGRLAELLVADRHRIAALEERMHELEAALTTAGLPLPAALSPVTVSPPAPVSVSSYPHERSDSTAGMPAASAAAAARASAAASAPGS